MNTLPAGYSLRVASVEDFTAVRVFYDCLIDDLLQRPYHPLWAKDGHPSDEYLAAALAAGELQIAEYAGAIVAAVVVNEAANDGYNEVPWQVQAAPGEFIIVHAFGVATRHQGRGLGAAMMHSIIGAARAAGKKSIRLDLIDHNRPTEKVYFKLGFTKCAEIRLYYEEVGWQLFHMFELPL